MSGLYGEMKKQYGHYIVSEEFDENGLWKGYTVSAIESTGKQGKLYLQSDGRENYKAKDDELEL